MTAAIKAVGLSKRYAMPSAPDGWLDALRDVSFEIQEGEAVGLIGRNGAGKSTLLKVLSRVTRPTAGYADVVGTVGALLEVGTGFHPDLTGRENTYLSGAILGLSKREVQARFDQIVAFAEMESFIDEPVKHYSSGMYARLGFAVAAHLRPSILIVDEVLAVGDLAFQAKCLAHMHRLTDDGTTVLFVTHSLRAVADLCPRALLLDRGRIAIDGPTPEVAVVYRRAGAVTDLANGSDAGLPVIVDGRAVEPGQEAVIGRDFTIATEIIRDSGAPQTDVIMNLFIDGADGQTLAHLRSDFTGQVLRLGGGTSRLAVAIEDIPLSAGTYRLSLRVVNLDPMAPLLIDSGRIFVTIIGTPKSEAPLELVHRFVQQSGIPDEAAR